MPAKGGHLSEEAKEKLRVANTGSKRSPEACAKMRAVHLGKKRSPAECAAISRGQRGSNRITLKGKKLLPETIAKMSLSSTGKTHSPETRLKMSNAHKGRFTGNENSQWIDGRSFLPYCEKFDFKFKERVRAKFGRKCYLCPITELENGRKLDVHHIDYNKNSICNGNEWAFLPLCFKCHIKTTHHRHYYFNLLINYWALNPMISL